MGISDSPRQLMNQLQRATACSTTGSAAKTKRASTTSSAGSHGGRTTAPRPNMGYISIASGSGDPARRLASTPNRRNRPTPITPGFSTGVHRLI